MFQTINLNKSNFIIAVEPPSTRALQISFENLLKTTDLKQDFEFLCNIKANRVQSDRIKVLHKKSGIKCSIQFTSEKEKLRYLKKTQIIQDYMTLHPMCKTIPSLIMSATKKRFSLVNIYYD